MFVLICALAFITFGILYVLRAFSSEEALKQETSTDVVPPKVVAPAKMPSLRGLGVGLNAAANSVAPIAYSSEVFDGVFVMKVLSKPVSVQYKSFFEANPGVTCEFVIQGRLKSAVRGEVFLALEAETIKLNTFRKQIIKMIAKVAKSWTKGMGLHTSTGSEVECAHIAMPVENLATVIVTPPHEEPPNIVTLDVGGPTGEVRERLQFNADDTYTFCVRLYCVDFAKWRVVNIPGVSTLNLDDYLNGGPLSLVAYDFDNPPEKVHSKSAKRHIFKVDVHKVERQKKTKNKDRKESATKLRQRQSTLTTEGKS